MGAYTASMRRVKVLAERLGLQPSRKAAGMKKDKQSVSWNDWWGRRLLELWPVMFAFLLVTGFLLGSIAR